MTTLPTPDDHRAGLVRMGEYMATQDGVDWSVANAAVRQYWIDYAQRLLLLYHGTRR